jgi:hypothetical protein
MLVLSIVFQNFQVANLNNQGQPRDWFLIAVTGCTFFCVGWFVSSLQSSPTYAVGGGLAAPLLIYLALGMASEIGAKRHIELLMQSEFVMHNYIVLCLVLSAVCLVAGCWLFLRRVEP